MADNGNTVTESADLVIKLHAVINRGLGHFNGRWLGNVARPMFGLLNRAATVQLEDQQTAEIAPFIGGRHGRAIGQATGAAGTDLNGNILLAINGIGDGRRNGGCVGVDLPQFLAISRIIGHE